MNIYSFGFWLNIIRKRSWIVLSALFLTVSVTATVSFLTQPVYRSSTIVMVERENANSIFSTPLLVSDTAEYMATQMGIIRSRAVAKSVVRQLSLDAQYREVQASQGVFSVIKTEIKGIVRAIRKGFNLYEPVITPDPVTSMADMISGPLSVGVMNDSRLLTISYDSPDPNLSATMANAFTQEYIRLNLEMKLRPARDNTAWIDERIKEVENNLHSSAGDVQQYREASGIASFDDRLNIAMQKLSEINSQLMAAEAKRYDAESRYRQLSELEARKASRDTLPEVINNALIQGLKSNQSKVSQEMSDISRKYGRQHPQYKRLEAEADSLQTSIDAEIGRVVAGIRNEYEVAQKREKALRAALAEQNRAALTFNRKAIELKSREEASKADRETFEALHKRRNEASLSSGYPLTNILLVDRAEPSVSPRSPRMLRNVFLAFLMGLFLGIGLALLIEYMDDTIEKGTEVEASGIPLLGVVPVFEPRRKTS